MSLMQHRWHRTLDESNTGLSADIAARQAVLVPVEVDEAYNVIDGHHRLRIASLLGLGHVPFLERLGLTDEAKQALANDLNDHRRQLSRDEWAERRRRRAPYIDEGVADGKTLEDIADELGVHKSTISRQRNASVVASATTLAENSQPSADRVIGKDGQVYSRHRGRVRFQTTDQLRRGDLSVTARTITRPVQGPPKAAPVGKPLPTGAGNRQRRTGGVTD
jgi:ParB-like chromosome segregation protein Spo0J